ncbi:hypothetical protein CDD83_10836 [Cordyceps sp. RAO-2017]|nr:hypothetical protein CDD83_10836 [Cordyceps sp. RAO-2017]
MNTGVVALSSSGGMPQDWISSHGDDQSQQLLSPSGERREMDTAEAELTRSGGYMDHRSDRAARDTVADAALRPISIIGMFKGTIQGGDQRNVNHEVVNQVDVNQLNPTQRSRFLLINQLNIITILSWLR